MWALITNQTLTRIQFRFGDQNKQSAVELREMLNKNITLSRLFNKQLQITNCYCDRFWLVIMRVFLLILLYFVASTQADRSHCPSSQTYSSELITGEFKSPGFPKGYIDYLNCVYEVSLF